MSVVTYNGVTLPYARMVQYNQEVVRDPDGDTDWYLNRFDIIVQQFINTDYTKIYFPDRDDIEFVYNPALLTQLVYDELMQPRKRLSIKFAGKELIPSTVEGVPGTVDAKNGPKPQSCRFMELTNTTFLCYWHVVAHYWVNPELTAISNVNGPDTVRVKNNPANPVLYNRWSESVDIVNNFVTRTRNGKFVIRSDNKEGWVADQLRSQFAVVGVPPNCLRKSSKYTLDPSGLAIAYNVVDQQVFHMPPDPAFEAEGWYRETTTINGAMRYVEAFVRLEADGNTLQTELLATAIDVVSTKCNTEVERLLIPAPPAPNGGGGGPVQNALAWGNGIINGFTGLNVNLIGTPNPGAQGEKGKTQYGLILQNAVAEVDMYKNEVSVLMRWLVANDPATVEARRTAGIDKSVIEAFKDISCVSPRSDPNYTPVYLDYGWGAGGDNIFLRAAKYYDPNLQNTKLGPAPLISPILDTQGVTTTGLEGKRQTSGPGKEPGTAGKDAE